MSFFSISLLACLVIRTLQLLFTVDGATGFIKAEYRPIGIAMMLILFLAVIVSVIIGISVRRCPLKMPKVSPLLGISSMLMGAAILYEVFSISVLRNSNIYQIIALEAFGCFAGIFFIAYGLKAFVKFKMSPVFFVIPVLYWAIKLIYVFTNISSLALITDNILLCVCYCGVLVFMLEYAMLANKINVERTSRILMASALCAANLSLVCSLPRFIAIVTGHTEGLHESVSSMVTVLFTGVFIILFMWHYFRNKNLARHHRKNRNKSNRFMAEGEVVHCDFYMGKQLDTNK